MKLYVWRGWKNGMMGSVFHLRRGCGGLPDTIEYEVGPNNIRHFRETFGIRRICLKCRKTARKAARRTG